MSKPEIDLAILKRLVAELESLLLIAEDIKTDVNADKIEFVVEMNKATGICAGILAESGLLMNDIQHLIQGVSAPSISKSEFLEKILGGLKDPGNTN